MVPSCLPGLLSVAVITAGNNAVRVAPANQEWQFEAGEMPVYVPSINT